MPTPDAPKKIPTWLWWTGGILGVAGIGTAAWYVMRDKDAGAPNPAGAAHLRLLQGGATRGGRGEPQLDEFTRAYIEAALATSTDESDESGGVPLAKKYGIKHIAPETLWKMMGDAEAFQRDNAKDLRLRKVAIGAADFWLTREEHGAGFWDGDWDEPQATRLSEAAEAYGRFPLYVHKGKIYAHATDVAR
jgi:hypothetical protein